jgi:hypothetical protein
VANESRPGGGAIERGTLVAFDSGAYTATVRLAGSISAVVAGIPVSRDIAAGEMLTGRRVSVAVFDAGNPVDAMVIGVY